MKLICKKNYIDTFNYYDKFIKGKIYEVVWQSSSTSVPIYGILGENNDQEYFHGSINKPKLTGYKIEYIWDYFFTIEEARKYKIESILK